MMAKYRKFEVKFCKIYKETTTVKKDLEETPVEQIVVQVWCEDICTAIGKAWQAVTVSPQNYEVLSVTTDEMMFRGVRYDECGE